ncbi:MAG: integrase arm-type DNA-binding domain-containing protein, partial [Proteobacteria bacterium]|nr:integrase arm-type DNA-binding domain-containing protein [Pseudomonadota bacterium]
MPFTDRQIAALKPKTTRYEKKEPGRTGLGVRVTPNGIKSWTFIYRFDGKQKRMVLGAYPQTGLAKAHGALADARDKLRQGIDPGAEIAEAREAERNAETVADLVNEYIERHAKPNMKPVTAAEEERILRREIIPHLGNEKAQAVTRRDLIVLLDGIADRGAPVMRNRTASVLSRFFLFGLDRGIVDASPAVGIRRLSEKPRNRFLSMEEIQSLWCGLDEI